MESSTRHKKIRVGFFGTRGLPARYGGFETIGEMLSKKIDKDFFELYVSQEDESVSKPEVVPYTDRGTFKILFPKSPVSFLGTGVRNVLSESNMIRECKKNPWELDVVLQCGSTPGFFMPNPKYWKNGPLILWNPDGLEWKRGKFPLHGRLLLWASTKRGIALSHAITIDSRAIAEHLASWIGNKDVYFIPSGADAVNPGKIDSSVLGKFGIRENEYYLLVARAAPENHLREILEWFMDTTSEKKLVLLTNIESDRYSRELKSIVEKGSSQIVYKGPLYDREKLESLRFYAYAYFHGHSVGGTNPSLLESMAAGCPPICLDVPFNREVAGESGLYFKDQKSFEGSLCRIESSVTLRNELSEKAIEIIRTNYSWDLVASMHEYVIMNALLNNKRITKDFYHKWLGRSTIARGTNELSKVNAFVKLDKEAS